MCIACQRKETVPPPVAWASPTATITTVPTNTPSPTNTPIFVPMAPTAGVNVPLPTVQTQSNEIEVVIINTATPAPPSETGNPDSGDTQNEVRHAILNTDPYIEMFSVGNGPNVLTIVGGIHGGYEWNAAELPKQLLEFLKTAAIPSNVTVQIIPVMNPYGFSLGCCGARGRFNANNVDLNRNWGWNWAATATWQGKSVSGGTSAFSEIETRAVRDTILAHQPKLVVFYHCCWASGVTFENEVAFAAEAGQEFREATGYTFEPGVVGITGNSIDCLGYDYNIPGIEIELPT
jgi:hypothetical protein